MTGESWSTDALADSPAAVKEASLAWACTRCMSVCTRRDLPKPGCPTTRTTWPIPS